MLSYQFVGNTVVQHILELPRNHCQAMRVMVEQNIGAEFPDMFPDRIQRFQVI